MKYLLTIIIFLFSLSTYGQDSEPTRSTFDFHGNNAYLSKDSSYFKQNKFMLGWHWGGSYKISKALNINQFDGFSNIDSNVVTGTNYFVKQNNIYTHCDKPDLVHAKAMMFFPALLIDSNRVNELQTISGDPWSPVFGFRYRHPKAVVATNPLMNGLTAINIGNDIKQGEIILQDPWPSNQLALDELKHDEFPDWDNLEREYCGKSLYISINLRRIDKLSYAGTNVLKIECPYVYVDSLISWDKKAYKESSIIFDSIPVSNNNDTVHKNRGAYLNYEQAPLKTTKFFIAGSALPDDNSSITISARFKLDDDENNKQNTNKKLKTNQKLDCGLKLIDSLRVVITKGDATCPIQINWVKFETPHAREYYSGAYDQQIINAVQKDLSFYDSSYAVKSRGSRLFRLSSHIEPITQDYLSMRYFNKLIGDIVVNEAGTYLPLHYNYYVNPSEAWYGNQKFSFAVAVPFMYKNNFPPNDSFRFRSLGLECGYKFNPMYDSTQREHNLDTLNSGYETWTRLRYYPGELIPQNDYDSQQFQFASGYISPQVFIEGLMYSTYFKPPMAGFQYSDKPWWNQAFITTLWKTENTSRPGKLTTYFEPHHRYTTGEELRYFTWSGIIMGAKGLFLDGPDDGGGSTQFRLNGGNKLNDSLNLNKIDDMEFLKKDEIGNDYLRNGQEFMHFDTYIDTATVSNYLNCSKDSIYLGRKSMRLELKKIYDWVKAVGDKLMTYKLMGWRGVGFKTWTNHSDKIQFDPIARYIDTNKTSSSKINHLDADDTHNIGSHPFYDLTVHQIKDTALDTKFILGLQNRRTDPLLYEKDELGDGMKFIPSAMFDDLVFNGGYGQLSLWWRLHWWNRLGCRKMNVVFKKPDEYKNYKATYVIKEIAKGIPSIDAQWWRQPLFMDVPNKTIVIWPNETDATLSVKMLPGEGKMLEVTPKYELIIPHCDECDSLTSNIKATIKRSGGNDEIPCYEITFSNQGACNYDSLSFRLKYKSNGNLSNISVLNPGMTYANDPLHNSLEFKATNINPNTNYTIKICSPRVFINDLELQVSDGKGGFCPKSLAKLSDTLKPNCNDLVKIKFVQGNCENNYKDSLYIEYLVTGVKTKIVQYPYNAFPNPNDTLSITGTETIKEFNSGNTEKKYIVYTSYNGIYKCRAEFSTISQLCLTKINIKATNKNIDQGNTKSLEHCVLTFDISSDTILCLQQYKLFKNGSEIKSGFLTNTSKKVSFKINLSDFAIDKYIVKVYSPDGTTVCDSSYYEACCNSCPKKVGNDPRGIIANNRYTFGYTAREDVSDICNSIDIFASPEAQPAYGLVVYNTDNPADVYYEGYRNSKFESPFILDGATELAKVCLPKEMPQRFTTVLFDENGSILSETAFDTTYVETPNPENTFILNLTGEPNPVTSNYTLTYNLSRSANTSILITDRFGVPITSVDLGEVSQGVHRQTFDFSALATGTYYGIVSANGDVKSILFAVYK